MSMDTESGKGRIWVIDVARFYAMVLVFYGHFIERFMLLKNPAGATQYKFIYSFHMVVFFVLAGYVVKESDIEFRFGKYVKRHLISRLLPFLFFLSPRNGRTMIDPSGNLIATLRGPRPFHLEMISTLSPLSR